MRRPGATLEAVLDTMGEGLLIALLIVTPLLFGTVQTWAVSLMEAGLVVLFGIWLCRQVWSRAPSRPAADLADPAGGLTLLGYRFARTGLGIPIALFVALVAFQLVPLPPRLVRLLSPEAAETFSRSLPGYARGDSVDFTTLETWLTGTDGGVVRDLLDAPGELPIQATLTSGAARPLSLEPLATTGRLLLLLALIMAFVVVVHGVRRSAQVMRILWVVTLLGFAMSVHGLVQRLQWNGKVYWFYPAPGDASPFGPFFNHNHFAAYLEMAAPLAMGILLSHLAVLRAAPAPGGADGAGPGEAERTPGGTLGALLRGGSDVLAQLAMSGFALVVMLAALVLSGSRGAMLSLASAVVIYGLLMLARGQTGRLAWLVGVAVVSAAIGFAAWADVGHLGEIAARLSTVTAFRTEPSLSARLVGWSYTLRILADYPLLGSGLGTFPEAWLRYYPPGTANIWKEAHNDYLQVVAETGAAGTLVFAWGLGIFLRRYLLWGAGRGDAEQPDLGYLRHGLAIGVLSILLHSTVDFSLQVAAIALLFVVLSGILVGAAIQQRS